MHKAQIGHKKEDIIAGICNAVANNYLNNLGKGKKIEDKVVFQGGVSKNTGVVEAFKRILGKDVYVDTNSHLMGALGVAILSKNTNKSNKNFDLDIENTEFKTVGKECNGCENNCEIVHIYKDNNLLSKIGGRCEKGVKL